MIQNIDDAALRSVSEDFDGPMYVASNMAEKLLLRLLTVVAQDDVTAKFQISAGWELMSNRPVPVGGGKWGVPYQRGVLFGVPYELLYDISLSADEIRVELVIG